MVKRTVNIVFNFLEKKIKFSQIRSKPWKFFIEVSLSCNLRCITCGHYQSRFGGIMSAEVFERAKPGLVFAKVVHEVGYGEPFLAPTFLDKLQYIKGLGAYINVYTNGTLLSPNISQKLVALGLDQITFSIDGGTKETFESIRIGADFSMLLENIGELNRIKTENKSPKPFIRANYVGMRRNIEELPQLIEIASRIGIQEVVLSDLFPPDEDLARESLFYCQDLADRAFRRAESIATSCRINLIRPSVFRDPGVAPVGEQSSISLTNGESKSRLDVGPTPQASKNRNPYPCYEPWQTLYVCYDGNVRPCCVINESFGNLLAKPISQIWNSEKYRLLRETVNTLNPAFEECKGCLLRRRVHFSLSEGAALWLRYVRNYGLFHAAKKALRYLLEYF